MEINQKKASELSRISKMAGQTELLVQAGGGNTSVKLDDRYMLVKASGFRLADVSQQSGYAVVDYRQIADCFRSGMPEDSREQAILAEALQRGGRPSIETFLHAVTKPYTIHTHPLGVSAYENMQNGSVIVASGLAVYDASTDTSYNDVFRRADKNMYIRKEALKEMK